MTDRPDLESFEQELKAGFSLMLIDERRLLAYARALEQRVKELEGENKRLYENWQDQKAM